MTRTQDGTAAGDTTLQRFLRSEGLTSMAIERRANISRPSFYRIRRGQDVRLSTMVRVLRAVRIELGRRVRMDEIFDVDPD